MHYRLIGFLAFNFIGMTVLNRILEGAFVAADEFATLNTLTITHEQSVYGLFTVPVLNLDFFFIGIPRLVKWDYSFFGGNAAIFQYFLYSLTFALAFALFVILIGMVSQFFARR